MSYLIRTLIVGLLILVNTAEADATPNVVVVLVDDLGWMDVGCQGSQIYETPHVDQLAQSGMRFTNGYAACAVCSPTRAALMTGRYPARLGITDWIRGEFQARNRQGENCETPGMHDAGKTLLTPVNQRYLPLDEITLAELLKPLGYRSCFIGKWHLGGDGLLPTDQGFDENHGGWDYGQPPSYFDPYKNKRLPDGIPTLAPRKEGEYLTDREADEAVRFIKANHDKPFFLYLSHYAVHTPIQAKMELVEQYADPGASDRKYNKKYRAMIQSVDESLGRILKTLEELNLTDNTIVVFTGDNGGLDKDGNPTENAPLRSGKGYLFEGGIRVPWIISWPGVTQPASVSDQPICSIDLFPTIAAAVNTTIPDDRDIDGIDVRPALEGNSLPERSLIWHFPHYRHGPGHDPYSIIRRGPWKLIVNYDPAGQMLFQLDEDLGEERECSAGEPERVAAMRGELDRRLRELNASLPVTK